MSIFPIGAKVGADTTAFVSSMGAATLGLKAFTGGAALAGAAIGVGLALALGTSVNAAREFQVELVKLNTLVGIQVEQIQEWEGAIQDLAVETGRMPADLARAMFAITSGGARGEVALGLLEQAAKASALGLGDMTSIGRAATAMLQAFGDEGLSAEKSIDLLLLTMRQGNLEAGGLATAFSRVLGPAKALGSSVEEIGAFMATFTRLGGSTEEAATGLLNMFNLLIKPPDDARAAMVEFGISIEEVRDTLAEDGLPAAMALMKDAMEGNVDVMGRMIPNVRSLIAFLNTGGLQAESFAADLEIMRDGLGATNEAFEEWGDSADAAFTRFSAQINVVAISIGELLLPPLTQLLDLMTFLLGDVREINAEWGKFFQLIGDSAVVDGMSAALEQMGLKTAEVVDHTETLQRLISQATDEKLLEQQGRLARQSSALRREIEALNASIEVQVDLPAHLTDFPVLAEDREQLKKQTALQIDVGNAIEQVTEEQIRRSIAEREVNEVVEESIVLSEEDADALEKRQAAIKRLVTTLQDELLVLREGEAALIDKQLVELNASPITRILVSLTLQNIQAEKDLAEAVKETAREKEQAGKAEERRLETLKAKREREAAVRTRALERADLARLNAEMQEATQIAQEMADTIGNAFDSIVDGTAGVADAFERMVTDILRQIQRLLIQRAIVEPLLNLILGQIGPTGVQTGGGAGAIIDTGGFDAVEGVAASVAAPGGRGGQTVIVQQTVNIHNDMIDQQSGDTFMVRHAPRLVRIIAEGVRESGDLADALRR